MALSLKKESFWGFLLGLSIADIILASGYLIEYPENVCSKVPSFVSVAEWLLINGITTTIFVLVHYVVFLFEPKQNLETYEEESSCLLLFNYFIPRRHLVLTLINTWWNVYWSLFIGILLLDFYSDYCSDSRILWGSCIFNVIITSISPIINVSLIAKKREQAFVTVA